jgi:hypothetical protein
LLAHDRSSDVTSACAPVGKSASATAEQEEQKPAKKIKVSFGSGPDNGRESKPAKKAAVSKKSTGAPDFPLFLHSWLV